MLGVVFKDKWILLLIPAAIAMVILGVIVSPVLSLIALLACSVIAFFLNDDQLFCLLVGLMPFGNIFKADANASSYFTLLEIVVLAVLLLRNKTFSPFFTAGFTLLAFFLFLGNVCGLSSDLMDIVKLLLHLVLLYLFSQRLSIDGINKAIFYLTIALITALILSLIDEFYFLVDSYFDNKELRVETMLGTDMIRRCSGLFNDPNYCSVAIITNISLLMVQYYYRYSGLEFWIFLAVLVPMGMFTYSKSYFLVIIVLLVLFYLFVLIPRHRVMAVLATVAGAVLVYFALLGKFESVNIILDRLSIRGDITTGRMDLLEYYVNYLSQNTDVLLFGRGISAQPLFGQAFVHNFPVDMVYRIGLFGGVGFLFVLWRAFPKCSFKKLRPAHFIPSICLFVMYFFLAGVTSYDFWYYFVLCFAAFKMSELVEEKPDGFLKKLQKLLAKPSYKVKYRQKEYPYVKCAEKDSEPSPLS